MMACSFLLTGILKTILILSLICLDWTFFYLVFQISDSGLIYQMSTLTSDLMQETPVKQLW